jgi:hypothetical protein
MFFLTTLYVDVKEPGRGRREMGLARSTVRVDLVQAPVFPAESAGKIGFRTWKMVSPAFTGV